MDDWIKYALMLGGIGLVIYVLKSQQVTAAAPITAAATQVVTAAYPAAAPYYEPTLAPEAGEEYAEGVGMQEALYIARDVIMGSPPYPIDDCHSFVNTGIVQLRIPYGYTFTFGYTCNKIGMMPMVATYTASATVINGVVSGVSIIRTHPP